MRNSPCYHEIKSPTKAKNARWRERERSRERGDRSGRVGGRRSPVSPIETSPVRERKRQAPIANGTDGTNARVASLFLPANHVKSLRPPLRAPLRVPLALPCTPTLFPPSPLSPRRLVLLLQVLQLCHELREKHVEQRIREEKNEDEEEEEERGREEEKEEGIE